MNTGTKYQGTKLYTLVLVELVTAAQYRGTTTYQQIAVIMGLPLSGNHMQKEVGWILGEISREEVRCDRPMLSAVVVKTSGKPGDGFYRLAEVLGREGADEAFWERERAAVYDTWQRSLPATT